MNCNAILVLGLFSFASLFGLDAAFAQSTAQPARKNLVLARRMTEDEKIDAIKMASASAAAPSLADKSSLASAKRDKPRKRSRPLSATERVRIQKGVLAQVCLKRDGALDEKRTKILRGIPALNPVVLNHLKKINFAQLPAQAKPTCFAVQINLNVQ
jgi:hypothetical protein